jgi:hypothetical protein
MVWGRRCRRPSRVDEDQGKTLDNSEDVENQIEVVRENKFYAGTSIFSVKSMGVVERRSGGGVACRPNQ